MECGVAHNLEPVNDSFGTGVRVQMREGRQLLYGRNFGGSPGEEETKGSGDDRGEDRWVNDGLPERCRGKNSATTEEKVHKCRAKNAILAGDRTDLSSNYSRCLHKTVH